MRTEDNKLTKGGGSNALRHLLPFPGRVITLFPAMEAGGRKGPMPLQHHSYRSAFDSHCVQHMHYHQHLGCLPIPLLLPCLCQNVRTNMTPSLPISSRTTHPSTMIHGGSSLLSLCHAMLPKRAHFDKVLSNTVGAMNSLLAFERTLPPVDLLAAIYSWEMCTWAG